MVSMLEDKAAYEAALAASSSKPLVIDFTASWCPPCKVIGPKFEAMHAQFSEHVTMAKLDVDANSEAAQKEIKSTLHQWGRGVAMFIAGVPFM